MRGLVVPFRGFRLSILPPLTYLSDCGCGVVGRFILINWALQLMNVAWFGLFSAGAPTTCIWNLIFANTNSLLLDSARLPIGVLKETVRRRVGPTINPKLL